MNLLLRRHLTRIGFNLTLGKTHIAALVFIDATLRVGADVDWRDEGRLKASHPLTQLDTSVRHERDFNMFVPGCRGLQSRGLVIHHQPPKPPASCTMGDIWQVTPAGEAVIVLLKESGIWDDYAAVLPDAAREATP